MSATTEQIAKNSEQIIASLSDEAVIEWVQVQNSQQQLMKGFQGTLEKFMSLRDNMQRNFLNSLKEMKQLDAKDLLKQVKDKKSEEQCLKYLVDYSKLEGDNATLDVAALREDAKKKQSVFIKTNQKVTEQLEQYTKWIQSFIQDDLKISKSEQEVQQQAVSAIAKTNDENKEEFMIDAYGKKVAVNFKFDQDKLNNIVSKIQVQRIPETQNLISIKTYSEIVEQSVELAEEEFIRLTFDNRKERRENQKDHQKYLNLMMDHLNEIENMLMKSQEDICKKLGISQEKLEQSEVCLMERGLGQKLFLMQASVRSRIKEKLPRKQSVGAKITREIIQHQIKILNDKQDSFIPVLKVLREMPLGQEVQQLVPVLLNLMISDLVQEEYNFEEEDYMHNLTDQKQFKEQEVMELLQGIEQGIVALLQNSGMIPKGMQPGMGGPGMGGPGMGGPGGMGGMPPLGMGGF